MKDHLRILTANLWSGSAHPEALARQLEALAVDVCAVQEMHPEQARAIDSVLPHGKLEPALDHRGMGIALRHPGEVQTLEVPERAVRRVRLEPEAWPQLDRSLELINVHMAAPHNRPWRALPTRRRQLDAVLRYLEDTPHPTRALVGDFNATPLWPLYRQLASRLSDAAHDFARRHGHRPRRTWGPRPWSPRLLRIDHAFTSGLHVQHVEVLTIAGSDHSGLLVDVHL